MHSFSKSFLFFTLFFIFNFFLSSLVNAQSELQFNQVLTYTGTLSGTESPTFTVPDGKVWKVEMVSSYCNANMINVNGIDVEYQVDDRAKKFFPIWLKAGDTIKTTALATCSYFFSIIEYNVIP